jgi:hypothetical protein
MRRFSLFALLLILCARAAAEGSGDALPAAYFPLLEAGTAKVERHLNATPNADLKALETPINEWRHFPYAILAPAVLYAKRHPHNARYRDPKMLALALRIGDLLASEHERGAFAPRLDSDWDTHLWLEAYRLLERELGAERRARWAKAIKENIAPLVADAKDRIDFPWYHSPFIGTSPNHYAQWAALLMLGGITFGDKEWEQLGKQILRRFAVTDQSPDGFWGEHNRAGPTVGYDHLMNSQAINSQFYLDRQGHLSVFHQRLGLIITGANSKRQPELATFSEKLLGQTIHMPISARLQMSDALDRLSLAYNTFFSDLYVPTPSERELSLRFVITGRGRPADEPQLTLQLCLKAGETLETGAGRKITLGAERIELQPADLGGWISHRGWRLKLDPTAKLIWPIYPHSPYSNAPETNIQYAVGALSVPLRLKSQPGRYIRTNEQEIVFVLEAQ